MTDTNPKNANAHRKQRETSIHRVIDAYEQGRGASACMLEIKRILKRHPVSEASKAARTAE